MTTIAGHADAWSVSTSVGESVTVDTSPLSANVVSVSADGIDPNEIVTACEVVAIVAFAFGSHSGLSFQKMSS
jgi:hypothetical protein